MGGAPASQAKAKSKAQKMFGVNVVLEENGGMKIFFCGSAGVQVNSQHYTSLTISMRAWE